MVEVMRGLGSHGIGAVGLDEPDDAFWRLQLIGVDRDGVDRDLVGPRAPAQQLDGGITRYELVRKLVQGEDHV